MKLKYYLRGMGIGILVTAVIMSISASRHGQMSDEEVKARARELGMVESTTLSNIASIIEKETISESTESPSTESENTESISTESISTETIETLGSGNTQTDNKQEEETKPVETKPAEATPIVSNEGEMVTIIIKSGESSVSVSKSLAEAGLVESASSFDKYLCSNGYDKKIVTGTHLIPLGTTDEEIAKVITGKLSFD